MSRSRILPSARAALCMPLACMALLFASGCTRPVTASGEWNEAVPRGQSFSRLLIVGVSPNVNQRCAFEEALAASLRGSATSVTTSCSAIGSGEPLTREAVDKAVAKTDADAVLATRLVTSSAGASEGGTTETRGDAYYKATDFGYTTGYWGIYGIPVVYGQFETMPSVLTVQGAVVIRSDLYATSGPTLVYTVNTKATKLESRDQALLQIAPAIAERLDQAGLLR